jgi:hypothetical protein
MEVIDMNAEAFKNHHRIQSSLMNVNKRLEEEILKLKAKLNEQVMMANRLEQQLNIATSSIPAL